MMQALAVAIVAVALSTAGLLAWWVMLSERLAAVGCTVHTRFVGLGLGRLSSRRTQYGAGMAQR